MKLLFLSHRIPWPVRDGGALAIHNNLKGFIDAGWDVKLLCLNPEKDNTSLEKTPSWFERAKPEAIKINTAISPLKAGMNLFKGTSYNVDRFYSRDFETRLKEVLRQDKYDVIHMEGAFIALYTDLIRSLSDACLVLREHNVEYRIWEIMSERSDHFIKKAYLNLLASRLKKYEETLWGKVDMISAISPDDLNYFLKFNSNSFMGGAGFELDAYLAKQNKGKEKSFFHLGSMDWLPNQEAVAWLMKEIWPALHSEFPDWKLHLAGKKMPAQWLADTNSLKIEGEVESAIDYMSEYQVMLVPLRSGSGVRIKTIEAMALGKTVITTSIGLRGLDLEPGKEVLVADDVQAFVDAVRQLEEEPDLAQRIGDAARRKVAGLYANERHIGRLSEKYRNCRA